MIDDNTRKAVSDLLDSLQNISERLESMERKWLTVSGMIVMIRQLDERLEELEEKMVPKRRNSGSHHRAKK